MNEKNQNVIQLNEALNRFVTTRHAELVIDQATFCHLTEPHGAIAGFIAHDVARGIDNFDEITVECFEVRSMRTPHSESVPCVIMLKRWGQLEWVQPALCYDSIGAHPLFKGAKPIGIAQLCKHVIQALIDSIGSTCQSCRPMLGSEDDARRDGMRVIPAKCEADRRQLWDVIQDLECIVEALILMREDVKVFCSRPGGYNYLSIPNVTDYSHFGATAAYLLVSGAVDHAMWDLSHGDLDPMAGGDYSYRRSYVIDALYPEFKVITSDDVIIRESCVTSYGAIGFRSSQDLSSALSVLLKSQDLIRSTEDALIEIATSLNSVNYAFDFSIIDDIYTACDVAKRIIAMGADNEDA